MMEDTHTYPTQTANTSTSNFEGEASHVANLEEKKKDSDNELLPNSEEAISTDEYPHGMRLALLVGAVVLTVFMTSLDQTIIGTAIPKITDEFHGIDQISWYGAAYFMCLGGFQSPWGKAYKYFHLKATFITTVVIFEIGSLLCGVAPNAITLIVGRAIAGLGGAGISTGGTTIFAFCVEPKKRPSLMGLFGVSYNVAAIIGPLLGGAFSERVSWRWCFYINLPIGGVAAVLVFIFFHLPTAAAVVEASWKEKLLQMDPVGIVLAMGSIISFILALQYGGQSHPWNSSVVIGLLVGSVLLAIAMGIWESFQGEYGMLVPRLLKRRAVWSGGIFQFFFAGCYFLLLYYLPIYFQSIQGVDAIQSGVHNLPMVIATCIFILLGGIVVSKTGYATAPMPTGAALGTVGAGLLYTFDVGTPASKWIGYQVLVGASLAFPFQNALNIVHADVDSEDVSSVTSILYFFQVLGGAFSVTAAQSAFVNRLIINLATDAPGVDPSLVVALGATQLRSAFSPSQLPGVILAYMAGIKATFAVAIGMVGVSFIVSFFLPWKRIHQNSASEPIAV